MAALVGGWALAEAMESEWQWPAHTVGAWEWQPLSLLSVLSVVASPLVGHGCQSVPCCA